MTKRVNAIVGTAVVVLATCTAPIVVTTAIPAAASIAAGRALASEKLKREELRSFSKGVDPRNFSMRTEGAIGNHDEDPRRAGCKNLGMHD
jgi:hypothetical protein